MISSVSRLQSVLRSLTERLVELIRAVPIERLERYNGVLFIAPDYYWGEASAEQLNEQLHIKRDYDVWIQSFQLLFRGSSDDLTRRIREHDKEMRTWIELGENWSLTSSQDENEEKLRAASRQLENLLGIVASKEGEIILVPDTNAIANESDPTKYRHIAGHDTYVFLLLPTVLAELDTLKNTHHNPNFREKTRRAIARIKGWRTQGTLLGGVTVHKTVTVRAIGTEPDMGNSLSWLDKDNRDDRIIASVLEVQSAHPTSHVVMVTGDVNLLNKADLASIEATELS